MSNIYELRVIITNFPTDANDPEYGELNMLFDNEQEMLDTARELAQLPFVAAAQGSEIVAMTKGDALARVQDIYKEFEADIQKDKGQRTAPEGSSIH